MRDRYANKSRRRGMDLNIFREFSQHLDYVNKEKVFYNYCSYKMILNTSSKAGDSSLISSGFNSNE